MAKIISKATVLEFMTPIKGMIDVSGIARNILGREPEQRHLTKVEKAIGTLIREGKVVPEFTNSGVQYSYNRKETVTTN